MIGHRYTTRGRPGISLICAHPNWFGLVISRLLELIRKDPGGGAGCWSGGLMHRFDSHQPHQSANPMASHTIASTAQMPRPSAGIRRLKALFVNPAYERRTQWALLFALVKPVRTVD